MPSDGYIYITIPGKSGRSPQRVRVSKAALANVGLASQPQTKAPAEPEIKLPKKPIYIVAKGEPDAEMLKLAAKPPANIKNPVTPVIWQALAMGLYIYIVITIEGQHPGVALGLLGGFFIAAAVNRFRKLVQRIRDIPRATRFTKARAAGRIIEVEPLILQQLLKRAAAAKIDLKPAQLQRMAQGQVAAVLIVQTDLLPMLEPTAGSSDLVMQGAARKANEQIDTIFYGGTKDERAARDEGNLRFLKDS